MDIHFPRYDAAVEQDAQVFQSVVWALQRQLPVEKEPPLVDHWEFLYARSIGCIGLLKMHLNRALNLALAEEAKTVTLAHLRKTAPSETRVELALRNALESEAELTESEGADERLLTLLGLRGRRESQSPKTQVEEQRSSPKNRGDAAHARRVAMPLDQSLMRMHQYRSRMRSRQQDEYGEKSCSGSRDHRRAIHKE